MIANSIEHIDFMSQKGQQTHKIPKFNLNVIFFYIKSQS